MTQEQINRLSSLGFELKSDEISAVKVDSEGTILFSKTVSYDPAKPDVEQVAQFVKHVESETGEFAEFGLAVPGLVDVKSNRIVYSAQFPDHQESDLASELASATGKRVYLENDANAAAYAEFKIGAGKGSHDLFYVTVGTGIGGAFIFNGRLRHGVSGFAGEFGFIATDVEGVRLEDVASAAGIVRRLKKRLHQDPSSSLYEIGEDNIQFSDILDAAAKEDGLAEMMLERTGSHLGIAVASVINLLNIETILIGGELMKAGDLVLEPLKAKAAELSFEPGFDLVSIRKGLLGSNAGVIGAAMLGLSRSN